MTVSSVEIEPHEELRNWYRVTITSRRDGIGDTKIELLCSIETLSMIAYQITQILKAREA